jgi:hypothetical protein
MIATALIFFSPEFHQRILNTLGSWFKVSIDFLNPEKQYQYKKLASRSILTGFVIFFLIHITLPFRHVLYPDELFWTEEGYRFSWRVMLMEKAGSAQFIVKDETGKQVMIDNAEFLTPLQEKMMATQPDMILQYAHILHDHYSIRGFDHPQVYVDSYVTLNGRFGKPLIDPHTNLAQQKESFDHKPWILTFNDEIKGF